MAIATEPERPARLRRLLALLGLALLAVAVAALPFLADRFYTQLATKIMIMAIFATSLDLLVGHTGLVSLGHAAFFGLAGYVLALLSPQYAAASFWLTLAAALAAAAAAALVVGFLSLRTGGVYFIMITLAFGQMLFHLFADTKFAGGSDGAYINVRPEFAIGPWRPLDLDSTTAFHLLVLGVLAAVLLLLRLVLGSPFGRVLAGIRSNEPRMRSLGYPTFRYKLAAFVISGTLAGLAGYLGACQFGFVSPANVGWHRSGDALIMVILGGMGQLFGPLLGAVAVVALQEVLSEATKHWLLPMGVAIMATALLLPGGLAGAIAAAWRRPPPAEPADD